MSYVIDPPPAPALPVAGSEDLFPVRRIYCVGRNYAAHAREMGFDPDREPPFFFMKPAGAIVPSGSTVAYPPMTENYHYEMELVVAIGAGGADIPLERALDHVWGYAAGLDMTRRDVQIKAREMGRPWDMGKGFDQSAPCAAVHPASETGHYERGALWLKVNGETKQNADISQMIWNVAETISYLSRYVRLEPGDLIFTGTPEGVGPTVRGDRLHGHIEGLTDITVTIG